MSPLCSNFIFCRDDSTFLFFFSLVSGGRNKNQPPARKGEINKRKKLASTKKRNSNAEDALAGELWDRHGRVEPWGFPVVSGIKPVAIDHNHSIKRIQ